MDKSSVTRFWSKQSQEIKNTILAAILVVAFVGLLYFYTFDSNITGFFTIGSKSTLSPYLEGQNILYLSENGYDGQLFLSIAFDPFLQNPGTIEVLDLPRLRYRRILYPLLGYILGFGNPQLIPYAMVGINCLSFILIVFVISLYLKKNGIGWQSLLTLFIPGTWLVISLSTSDLLNSLLLVTSIYLYKSKRPICTAISLAGACLTRSTSLLIWFAILFTSIWERKWRQLPYLFFACIPAFIWNIYVLYRLNNQGGSLGFSVNFGYPLFGIFEKVVSITTGGIDAKNIFEAYSLALLIVIFISIILNARQSLRENKLILIGTIFYGVLFIMSSINMLNYFGNYSRQYMNVYFLLLLSQSSRSVYFKTLPMAAAGLASLAYIYGVLTP